MVPDRTGDFSIAAGSVTAPADGQQLATEKSEPFCRVALGRRGPEARKPGNASDRHSRAGNALDAPLAQSNISPEDCHIGIRGFVPARKPAGVLIPEC
jgi:hypothetical protein